MSIKQPVWTWEVPAYFFLGGVATGSSFAAVAADLSGDHRAARRFRTVALAAAAPCGPLLVSDLGRPGRFLNMLRIVKPRSPMNTGAWALAGFTGATAGAVVAGRTWLGRTLGGGAALIGIYLGSYTGVLLATTAVPVWARNRTLLGPLFVASATATGTAACGLVSSAGPTRDALRRVETGAVVAETALGLMTKGGHTGPLFGLAHGSAIASLVVGRRNPRVANVLTLGSGLALRYAWLAAGRSSAATDPRPNRQEKDRSHDDELLTVRSSRFASAYAEGVRRASLAIEETVRRARR